MTKIFNFIKDNTTKIVFGLLVASAITSCDPTIDSLSFDIDESADDTALPNAGFSYFQTFNEEANTILVTFSNSSTNSSIYNWDFGNGQTSTQEEDTAAYENPGLDNTASFDVSILASDAAGNTNLYSETITITGEFREFQITDEYTLINTGDADDPVSIFDFSSEQGLDDGRTNFASNLLDKDGGDGGATTVWTSNDELTGDAMGDGEYVIFDLGSDVNLGLIRFSTNNQVPQYAYQILTSTTGTADADFSILLPQELGVSPNDWAFTDSANIELQVHILNTPTTARYVKLITYGRYSSIVEPLVQDSLWSNWAEIEFFSPI